MLKFEPVLFVRPAIEVKLAGETGHIAGYASTFGGEPDVYGDVIAKGAFSKSLARHKAEGTAPVMLWTHDQADVIGRWDSMTEDGTGLKVEGHLDMNVAKAREALSLLKGGAVSGLSIGFRTAPGGSKHDGKGIRTLTDVDLVEVSLVAIPANRRARVTDVKSVSSMRDFERFLHDNGFSKSVAARLAKGGWQSMGDATEDEQIQSLADMLNAARRNLRS
jgi:uncharacterized protein